VSLVPGPALAAAAGLSSGDPATAIAAAGAGAFGAYDDVAGQREGQRSSKGLRGHARALARGQVTAGAVKVVGIGIVGLTAGALAGHGPGPADPRTPGRRPVTALGARAASALLDGALVAGSANLLNLFDLRPGRALKVGLLAAVALDAPGPAGAAAALLPGDLRERAMLGDAGANGLGAALGVALVRRLPRSRDRAAALAVVTALTAASEVVSFSRVIEAVPPLRALDRVGRQP
jgi:hypothetical protein